MSCITQSSIVSIQERCGDIDLFFFFLLLEEDRGRSPHVVIKLTASFDNSIKKWATEYKIFNNSVTMLSLATQRGLVAHKWRTDILQKQPNKAQFSSLAVPEVAYHQF